MLGMIKKDLFMIKENSKIIFLSVILYLFYSFTFDINLSFIFPFISFTICFSTFSYDDYSNWYLYAVSLPGSRRNVVRSKYIFSILLVFTASLLGLIFSIFIGNINSNFNIIDTLENNLGMLLAIFLLISLLYPFVFKYGSEKGRISIMIISFSIMGIYLLLKKVFSINIPVSLIQSIDSYYLLFILISFLLLYISYVISNKIYMKKEF